METLYRLSSPPLKNTAWTFECVLFDASEPTLIKTGPTLAAGDVQVSKDGGAFANITDLPVQIGSTGVLKVTLTATEMNADRVAIKLHDAAGDEWVDLLVTFSTVQVVAVASTEPLTSIQTAEAVLDAVAANYNDPGSIGEAINSCTGGGGCAGAGAVEFVYTLTDDVTTFPIGQAVVWATTDIAGNNVIASGQTDDFGNVTFYLDVGTYYFWSKRAGYNFSNPDVETVV